MKILACLVLGCLLSTTALAQDGGTGATSPQPRLARIVAPANPEALRAPADVTTAFAELEKTVQALQSQVAALQAQNQQLKAQLDQLNTKVDGNQWNQAAALANLKADFAKHTHTFQRTSIGYSNVIIDGKTASLINKNIGVDQTTSAPNP